MSIHICHIYWSSYWQCPMYRWGNGCSCCKGSEYCMAFFFSFLIWYTPRLEGFTLGEEAGVCECGSGFMISYYMWKQYEFKGFFCIIIGKLTISDHFNNAVARNIVWVHFVLESFIYYPISVMPECTSFIVVWLASSMALGVLWAFEIMLPLSTGICESQWSSPLNIIFRYF